MPLDTHAAPGKESRIMIQRIGVIGAGQMGNGIAHVAALKGFDVKLFDVDAEPPRAQRGRGWFARQFTQIERGYSGQQHTNSRRGQGEGPLSDSLRVRTA